MYKLHNDFKEFEVLQAYGFYKTMPKGNPWWQIFVTTDWRSGLGFGDEIISIHNQTREVNIKCEDEEHTQKLKDLISKLIEEGIIVKSE